MLTNRQTAWMATADGPLGEVTLGVSRSYAHAVHLVLAEAYAMWQEWEPDNTWYDFLAFAGFYTYLATKAVHILADDYATVTYGETDFTIQLCTIYGF